MENRVQIKTNDAIQSYVETTSFIDNLYQLFQSYASNYAEAETLQDFADTCIAHGDYGLSTKLNILHELVTPKLNVATGLLKLLFDRHQTKENGAKHCGKNISLQQEIYGYYKEIFMYLVKGYIMKLHAYKILKVLYARPYVHERRLTKSLYRRALRDTVGSTLSVMQNISRDIRSCDAKNDEEGETYIELKWLFNIIALHEAYLNEWSSCYSTCPKYQVTNFYPYAPNPLSELDTCRGKLYDCFFPDSKGYCPTTKSSRRYNGLLTPDFWDNTIGSADLDCSSKESFYWKFININNAVFWSCDVCACYCDDYTSSATVRTFSLKAVQSSISDNKVITGVRFVERNRIIYIQIQEGKLSPNGVIPNAKWLLINESINTTASDSPNDYFQLTYRKKAINLDTLSAPIGQVLTGIKLSAKESNLGLEIQTNRFDYASGIVYDGESNWISNDEKKREEITMDAPDIPIHATENIVDTRENTYVNFRMTDWEKDFGQTAIPFIDAQPVISDPPHPLTGAGLYYRGETGYGGFIALKLVAYDYSSLLNVEIRPDGEEDELQGSSDVEEEDETRNADFVDSDSASDSDSDSDSEDSDDESGSNSKEKQRKRPSEKQRKPPSEKKRKRPSGKHRKQSSKGPRKSSSRGFRKSIPRGSRRQVPKILSNKKNRRAVKKIIGK